MNRLVRQVFEYKSNHWKIIHTCSLRSRAWHDTRRWQHSRDLDLPRSNRKECDAASCGLWRWWRSLTEREAQPTKLHPGGECRRWNCMSAWNPLLRQLLFKSLQLIWSPRRWNLWVPNLPMSCRDLIIWQGTTIVTSAIAFNVANK